MVVIRIYSVGVWNQQILKYTQLTALLEFTPLEFETIIYSANLSLLGFIRIYSVGVWNSVYLWASVGFSMIRIYSVGVWNTAGAIQSESVRKLEFTPLEFETSCCCWLYIAFSSIRIYSVGVWNKEGLSPSTKVSY